MRPRGTACLLLVIALAGFGLRAWRAAETMRFTGDEARDVWQAKNITARAEFPLIGPKIYRDHGHLGPAYAYLMAAPLWLARYDPASTVLVVALFDSLAILLLYRIAANLFGIGTALWAAALYATNFTMIFYARWGWHPSLLPFFTLLSINGMIRVAHGDARHLPVIAGGIAVAVQQHLSAAVLGAPALFAMWWGRHALTKRTVGAAAGVALLLLGPLVVYEVRTGGANLRAGREIRTVVISEPESSFARFLADAAQAPAEQAFWPYGFRKVLTPELDWMYGLNAALLACGLLAAGWLLRRRAKAAVLLLLWLILPLLVLARFGGQRSHYYLLGWFPLPILATAALLGAGFAKPAFRWVAICIAGLLVTANLAAYGRYVSWVRQPAYDTFLSGPLRIKKQCVRAVITGAAGRPYDVLVVSWDWSNHRPYAYLFDNEMNRPNRMNMLVANLESGEPIERHHIELTRYGFPRGHPAAASETYIILEPAGSYRPADARLVADLGQMAVWRADGPVAEFGPLLKRPPSPWSVPGVLPGARQSTDAARSCTEGLSAFTFHVATEAKAMRYGRHGEAVANRCCEGDQWIPPPWRSGAFRSAWSANMPCAKR